jgi:transcriptional regulator with XRE-family HTH domain
MLAANWCESLAATMKLLREIKRMGLREHARSLGINSAKLCRIEQGKPCDVDTLVYIHEKTGIPYDTLLGSPKNRGEKRE